MGGQANRLGEAQLALQTYGFQWCEPANQSGDCAGAARVCPEPGQRHRWPAVRRGSAPSIEVAADADCPAALKCSFMFGTIGHSHIGVTVCCLSGVETVAVNKLFRDCHHGGATINQIARGYTVPNLASSTKGSASVGFFPYCGVGLLSGRRFGRLPMWQRCESFRGGALGKLLAGPLSGCSLAVSGCGAAAPGCSSAVSGADWGPAACGALCRLLRASTLSSSVAALALAGVFASVFVTLGSSS